jgi:hypothetical protein
MTARTNRYGKLIEAIFFKKYHAGDTTIEFDREEFAKTARSLGISLPKNIGDVIYAFRYRAPLPSNIRECAPDGMDWVIRPAGKGLYRFMLTALSIIRPNTLLAETKILDATPGMLIRYALNDEQSLLARIRYNRLIDIFSGVTCYPLQSHLRTTVPEMGQVETDEVYVGVDKRGVQYVFPVQAKGKGDLLNIIQIEQDAEMCRSKFPILKCCPIAAQLMKNDLIALFSFEGIQDGVAISDERHYRLVPPEGMTDADLATYRSRLASDTGPPAAF